MVVLRKSASMGTLSKTAIPECSPVEASTGHLQVPNKETIQNAGDKEPLLIKASRAPNRPFIFPCYVHISIRTKDGVDNKTSGSALDASNSGIFSAGQREQRQLKAPKSTKVEATKTSFSLDPRVTPAQCHLVKVSHRASPGSLCEGLQKGVNTGKQGSLGPICEDQLSQ